ncbi:coadhesin-like isoform X2 [Argopecten irradians]|uniref:coadhesin-like isoform X2 n=1 Tax=Argopecten irradians TaxID=31199 RepID=UPI0037206CAD
MPGRRSKPYQVYIPPVDYMYDNNINGPAMNQHPSQYSDPPPYQESTNQTDTNVSDGSHYMQHLGANRYDMQSQSGGTVRSTRTNCTYDYVQDVRIPSYYPDSAYASGGGDQMYTKKGRSHRYVIIVAVVLVVLAILGAAAAAALKVTVFKDERVFADAQQGNNPMDGVWSDWPAWTDCSSTCGNGTMTRHRTCDNPSPVYGGDDCEGSTTETQTCMLANCSVNGNWSEWNPWTDCSESCGNGTRNRNRICDYPPPAFGGNDCVGFNSEEELCMLQYCPINGNWSNWENWSGCSTTCGGGIRNRTRHCDNPTPQHSGQDCEGINSETSSCAEDTCPPPGIWGMWSEWNDCSKTCGEGVSTRTRPCDDSAGGECIGADTETQTCQDLKCYDPWLGWSDCSLTCGTGIRTRERTCDGRYTGQECGWHYPTFRDTKTCTNSAICQPGFCESRSANCSYNHPTRCDMYIRCDAGKIMHEQVCNVLMWYQVQDTNPCLGHCNWKANVQCTI